MTTKPKLKDVNKHHDINVVAVAIAAVGFIVASSWVAYLSEIGACVFWGKDRKDGDVNRYLWASLLVTGIIIVLIVIACMLNNRGKAFKAIDTAD